VGPDQDRVIRLWSQSGLGREGGKWKQNPDYVTRTVRRASPWHRACEPAREGGAATTEAAATEATAIAAAEALAAEQEGIFKMAFKLARRLMVYFDGSDPEQYRPAVEAYCRKAGVEEQVEDYVTKVAECWGMVRSPEGEGDWKWAVKQATERTIDLPGKVRSYRLAYTLCHNLSQIRPGQAFPLPVEKMAKFLGVSKRTGANMVKWLERDGVLLKAAEHSLTQKKASEFFFRKSAEQKDLQKAGGICTQTTQTTQDYPDFSGLPSSHRPASLVGVSREAGGCTEEQYTTHAEAAGSEDQPEDPDETCSYYLADWPCPKEKCADCHPVKDEAVEEPLSGHTDTAFPAKFEAVARPQEPPRSTSEPPRPQAGRTAGQEFADEVNAALAARRWPGAHRAAG
jgi:hypothetical protein